MNIEKKSIAILIPDLRFGGAEKVYINLSSIWLKNGYEVIFILMNSKGEFYKKMPKKIKIISLNVKRIRQVIFPLIKVLKKEKIDVLLAAMWPLTSAAVIAWILSGKKNLLYLCDHVHLTSTCKYEINIPIFILKIALKLTYPFANGIICVSKGVKDNLCSLVKIPKKQIKVIYNPITKKNINYKFSKNLKNKLWGRNFNYKILSVGALKVQKDHKTLLKAFSLLIKDFNCKLIVVGDGYLKNDLLELIQKLKLQKNVKLVGYYSDLDIWYKTADLFVLSSRWEGFANVIVESLQFGLPVVSTNCLSGPSEILNKGKYGSLVPISDPKKLCVAMKKSLIKKHKKSDLIKRSKYFDIEKISYEYLNYFKI